MKISITTLKLLKANTTIIDKAETARILKIVETINIIKLKPKLNKQIDNWTILKLNCITIKL